MFLFVLYMNLVYMSLSSNCRSEFYSRNAFVAYSIVMPTGMLYITSLGFLSSCTLASSSFPHVSVMLVLIFSISSLLPVSIKILPSFSALNALIPIFFSVGFIFVLIKLLVCFWSLISF